MVTAPVVLVGAGGHARVLLDLLRALELPVLGFVDTRPDAALSGLTCLGSDEDLVLRHGPAEVQLVNGLGSTRSTTARRAVFDKLAARGYRFRALVHPAAVVAPDVVLGGGAQVMAGAVVQTGSHLGENVIVNTGATVDHDCRIGSHAHLAPGVTLSGRVSVGEGAHVGTGSIVIQDLSLGADCLVAAGSIVVKDVAAGATLLQRRTASS